MDKKIRLHSAKRDEHQKLRSTLQTVQSNHLYNCTLYSQRPMSILHQYYASITNYVNKLILCYCVIHVHFQDDEEDDENKKDDSEESEYAEDSEFEEDSD